MTSNLGVKALLGWVNSIKLSDRELTMDDLQDGTVLLKIFSILKKESATTSSSCIDDNFRLIADFIESEDANTNEEGDTVSC